MRRLPVCCVFVFTVLCMPARAAELEGIEVPDSVQPQGQPVSLVLNGVGMRSKFVFDVYVTGLYLPARQTDATALLASPPANRVLMHFVYDKVEKKKLDAAWREGFEDNQSSDQLALLEGRLTSFTAMFDEAVENDVVLLDYFPDRGTRVTINNDERGWVEGADFNSALLAIWIGGDPISKKLRSKLLGK